MEDSQEFRDHLKSLNPNPLVHPELKFGRQFKLFRDNEYLGIATWTDDKNIGPSFQSMDVGEDGLNRNVYLPDRWEAID